MPMGQRHSHDEHGLQHLLQAALVAFGCIMLHQSDTRGAAHAQGAVACYVI